MTRQYLSVNPSRAEFFKTPTGELAVKLDFSKSVLGLPKEVDLCWVMDPVEAVSFARRLARAADELQTLSLLGKSNLLPPQ